MENLGHDVTEAAVDVVSQPTCPIKQALPKVAVFAAVAGVLVLGWKLVKKAKAKKAALLAEPAKEVDPEESK